MLLFSYHFISYSQTDSSKSNEERYRPTPRIAGGQIEATTILYVTEIGGLVDIDFVTKAGDDIKSFGIQTRHRILRIL